MADKEPARKSRREVLYDRKKSVKPSSEATKPEPKAEAKPEPKSEAKPEGGGRSHAEMLRRHENDRRDMHGRHRTEHRAIDANAGDQLHTQKVAAHRRHEREFAEMHQRHEAEIAGATAAAGDAAAPDAAAAPAGAPAPAPAPMQQAA